MQYHVRKRVNLPIEPRARVRRSLSQRRARRAVHPPVLLALQVLRQRHHLLRHLHRQIEHALARGVHLLIHVHRLLVCVKIGKKHCSLFTPLKYTPPPQSTTAKREHTLIDEGNGAAYVIHLQFCINLFSNSLSVKSLPS